MEVIKRDGTPVNFEKIKIVHAIEKANEELKRINPKECIKDELAVTIANRLYERCRKRQKTASVEEIQDMVEMELMREGAYELARTYVRYRQSHKARREFKNTIDNQMIDMLMGTSEYWNEENSNKNARLVTTQRDYMAGIVSEDLSKRYLLPPDVVEAHKSGIIHFHDIDYFAQNALHNCDLINLDDMLQNGTVISGVKIDKPHSFATACTIATQIIAQVASSQYGFPIKAAV